MTKGALGEDEQARAMVALIEAQSRQIESLRRAVEMLEGRLALRSELDVIVAHEVRTPLTVVAGALDTMQGMEPGDPRMPSLVEMAAAQAEHLAAVVDDLLAPQGTGGPPVQRTRLTDIALSDVMRRALASVSTDLAGENVEVDVPEGLVVTTSPARLTAMLVNLLQNAVRYGRPPIECHVLVMDGTVRIEVRDRGPGLAGADPEDLFEAFVQGPESHPAGKGVGLYLVRMLARSMGGEATLEDRPEGGCRAIIDLPQRRSDDALVKQRGNGEASVAH